MKEAPELSFAKERSFPTFLEGVKYLEEKNLNPDLIIIDIDGVLTDVSFQKIFYGSFLYLTNKDKFKEFTEENKIPLRILLKLARLARNHRIILLTNRFISQRKSLLSNIFPFISKELIEKFQSKLNIQIIASSRKPFINKSLRDLIRDHKNIIYFGSGYIDRMTFKALRKVNQNITYFQIGKANLI